MSTTTLYTIGFFILLGCGVYAAVLLHVPATAIVVGGLAVNGLGIMWASSYTTRSDPPAGPPRP